MGLSALLGAADDEDLRSERTPDGPPHEVPIESIRPSRLQPRRTFAADELKALADSIRSKGVMQPLLVRPTSDSGSFEIVAGERRWRAAQMAGVHDLPVVVRALDDRDALELALIENIQRQDLTPLEEAAGYQRLIDEFGHTQEELARTLGKSRSHVANTIRLLGLPAPVRTFVDEGRISAGHARALLVAKDPLSAAREVIAKDLNVRQTEALVKALSGRPDRAAKPESDADTRALEHDMSLRLGMPVSLRPKGSGGTMTIAYRSLDQLNRLLQRLG
jgi:ParB family chromosome partitioning protein